MSPGNLIKAFLVGIPFAMFLVGIIISCKKGNWRYFAVALCISLIFMYLSIPYKQEYRAIILLMALAIPFFVYDIWAHERKVKDRIKELTGSTFYLQTGKIPEAVIGDNDVQRELSQMPSVTITTDPGSLGEFLISNELSRFVNDSFKFIHNVYIHKEDGSTSEIDIVCVTSAGLFVIESKNYSGVLYCYEDSQYWTQYLQEKKSTFYNPVLQNRNHIKALSKYTDIDESLMTSIVVFSDKCELRKLQKNTRLNIVIQLHDLNTLISFLLTKREAVWSAAEVDAIYKELLALRNPSQKEVEQHIQDAKYAKFEYLK